MQYRNTSYADGEFDVYWYEKNLQGDVVSIYNDESIKVAIYSYDAWGNSTVYYPNNGSCTATVYNPFRYRGYYRDVDTGFYYLNSRYYDPATCRFLNLDNPGILRTTPTSISAKNLYAYCGNNPVTRTDEGGYFWDTVFDVVSLAFSVADVIKNPDDPWAWAGLAGDVVDLIPFVTGVGEITRAVNIGRKALDAADTIHDTAKTIDNVYGTAKSVDNVISISSNGIRYTDKVLKQMGNASDLNHSFPSIIDTFVDINSGRPLKGGDGVVRNLIEIPGSVNNKTGVFEYLIEPDGMCNHRYFKELKELW